MVREPGGPFIVAIDGPSGVGKSTISRKLAAELGYTYLDTGAMYRAVAWYFKSNEVDPRDGSQVERALENIDMKLLPAASETDDVGVVLNGEDVSAFLRTSEISMLASTISALPRVRAVLTRLQQHIGACGGIVAEGRDTGTVVFPEARFKFYLDAGPEERARRRVLQLRARGEAADEREVLALIRQRGRQDRERSVAPLRRAPDAVVLDTTALDAEAVFAAIRARIESAASA